MKFVTGVLVCVLVGGCGKKEKVSEAADQEAPQPRTRAVGARAEARKARPGEPTGGAGMQGARPARTGESSRGEPQQAGRSGPGPGTDQQAARAADESGLPISQGAELPGRDCVRLYRSGTTSFRAKEYEKAVRDLAEYVKGRCVGRVSQTVDLWAAWRGMLAACRHPSHRHLHAFQQLLEKVCEDQPEAWPCKKGPACPKEQENVGPKCRELYKEASGEFKAGNLAAAYDKFLEYAKTNCFSHLTRTTWEWSAYRALVAAEKLGRPKAPFLPHARRVCRESQAWPCEKLRALKLIPR